MKKTAFFSLFFCFFSLMALAGAGDTVTVRVHDRTHMNWYGSFDKKALFPPGDQSFRKAWLYFTIGCPDAGCSPWDYTTKIFVRRHTGVLDTAGKEIIEDVEISRYITPYATGYDKNFKRLFRMDVTDYLPLLKDSVEIRLFYEGYSDGFAVTTDFQLIKGNPTRKTLGIETVYSGYFDYGNPNSSIEDRLVERKFKAPAGTASARIRTLQTGHGGETSQNCAEFCKKSAYWKINGEERYENVIWRDNCGLNPLFPQPGTWLYDRANWCPGSSIIPFYNEATPFISMTDSFALDMDMSDYTNNVSGKSAGYNIASQLIYYAPATYTNDIELEDIISPSRTFEYNRMNPICAGPKIRIRNNRATALTSCKISYGVADGTVATVDWSGNIEPYGVQDVELAPIALTSNAKPFFAQLSLPNGSADDQPENDALQSAFDIVPEYPGNMIIELKTNGKGNQSEYYITDPAGNLIMKKSGLKGNITYRDTIALPDGCYQLKLIDKNKDGLSFNNFNADGSGVFKIRNMNNNLLKTFDPNFGTETGMQFMAKGGIVGISDKTQLNEVYLFPNPANNNLTLVFNRSLQGQVRIYDYSGKLVQQQAINTLNEEVNLSIASLSAGMYVVQVQSGETLMHKKLIKE